MESRAIVKLKRSESNGADDASATIGLSDLFSITVTGQGEHVAALMNLVLPYVLDKHLAREMSHGRTAQEVRAELQQVLDDACDKAGLSRLCGMQHPAMDLATQIADYLFTDGNGKKGDRLQIMHGDWCKGTEKPGGGWCYEAVQKYLFTALEKKLWNYNPAQHTEQA